MAVHEDLMRKQQRREEYEAMLKHRKTAIATAAADKENRLQALEGRATPVSQIQGRIASLAQEVERLRAERFECEAATAALTNRAARLATLQCLQSAADAREVASNRRNASIKNEAALLERDIDAIANTEAFKMRVVAQNQLRQQCKEFKAKIDALSH